jgi:YHS domain-containing protein
MQNRFSKTILTLACLLAFAWTSVFAQTKDVPKTTPVKKQVECKADTSKMPCPMGKAKMDSCCMKEGRPCKHMKMQGCCSDSSKKPCPMDKAKMDSCCMKEGQPCKHMKMQGCCSDSSKKPCPMEKAKMDSCCKKEGKPGMHMQRQGCASDSLKKPCPMEKTKMKKEGKASIQQKTCPVTGEPADQNVFLDYQGKRFYFCCAACKEKFQESPQTYLKKTK